VAPDPFVAVAAGRSYFRIEDLLGLVILLRALRETNVNPFSAPLASQLLEWRRSPKIFFE